MQARDTRPEGCGSRIVTSNQRGLAYLRDAGVAPDARMADAVAVLRTHQQPDGRWLLEDSHAATTLAVAFDEATGQPSRWNTLRVLRRYDLAFDPTWLSALQRTEATRRLRRVPVAAAACRGD